MTAREKLHEAFGELIYSICKTDGDVQESEVEKLKERLKGHSGAESILWSFNYENYKSKPVADTYRKAMFTCKDHGPDPEYPFLLNLLKEVAAASNGLDEAERNLVNGFEAELKEQFIKNDKADRLKFNR